MFGALAETRSYCNHGEKPVTAKKVRVGVVGGGFGPAFPWHEHPNSCVQGVAELNEERRKHLGTAYRCDKQFDSIDGLLADSEIDAVAIFSGAPAHVPHAVAAMKAGKHVISAVPAAISLEQCEQLRDTVEKTGMTYMMAETSYYYQAAISARKFYQEGKFGNLFFTEAEYHHPGLEELFFDHGQRTWRHGFPPMLYPTHCTAFITGVTGERLTTVSCVGWGDDNPILKDNAYQNPFWNETAFFKTDRGNSCRVAVWWRGAERGTERAQWYGDKMSFFMADPNGAPSQIIRSSDSQTETDDAGFVRRLPVFEQYDQPQWWKTMLPEPLRHGSGHDGAHPFLVHEFISALVEGRRPKIDIYESLAYTVPGIIAHQSALQGGAQLKVPNFDRGR